MVVLNEFYDGIATGKKVRGVDIVTNAKFFKNIDPKRIDFVIGLVNSNYSKIMDKAAKDIMSAIKSKKFTNALKKYPNEDILRKNLKIKEAFFLPVDKIKRGRGDQLDILIDTNPVIDTKFYYEINVSTFDGEFNMDYAFTTEE